ncbi:aminotransferase class V-fold PLP-dependent enzyme [Alkalilimnicola ehrlichii]|uniref:aminotransferase class V-fold PLP-dependent enzyme n=1 Tax=Alkalilimnicola ehrlichii TaxID=351052 RepID=UPI0026D3ECA4|nr:aminotransferase class V-fold PLP-dependent enzyme [Alkalilimnicola ehrlichii]
MTEFPHEEDLIYLNHAGVGPWPRRTAQAVVNFADQNLRSGARHYPDWLAAEQRLRERFARLLNAPSSDDIALVKNTSEGLSLVAYGLDWQSGDEVIINKQEFPSNRIVWESLQERFGVRVRDIDLGTDSSPEERLLAAVNEHTRLLAVSSVQYGTGLRMNLERLGAACRERNVLFCVDAIQSLGALRFDAQRVHADFVIADGHKWMLAPEGLGVFYSRPESRDRLRLLQYGWHMVAAPGDYSRSDWSIAPTARASNREAPTCSASMPWMPV